MALSNIGYMYILWASKLGLQETLSFADDELFAKIINPIISIMSITVIDNSFLLNGEYIPHITWYYYQNEEPKSLIIDLTNKRSSQIESYYKTYHSI